MPNKSGQPVRRDLDVLEHVRRYKLTTKAALRTQPFFQGAGKYAVDTVVDRLKSREHFSSHQLSNGQVYFQLGRAAANLLGVHERISRPLGDEPAIRAYTILSFCCLQGEQREQLTREELERAFPGSYERGARVTYYIDNEGTHDRLAYLRVDMGAVTRWDKLLTKLKQDIQKRCDNQTFRRLIDARRFQYTVLTATDQKAVRLVEAANEQQSTGRFPSEVEVKAYTIPELLDLVAPRPKAAAKKG